MANGVRQLSEIEEWLRSDAGFADDRAATSKIMATAVAWHVGVNRRRESPRREEERAKFRHFFAMVLEGADSVEQAGQLAGFTTERARDLVRMFVEEAITEMAAVGVLSGDDMEVVSQLAEQYGKELNFGGEVEASAVRRTKVAAREAETPAEPETGGG